MRSLTETEMLQLQHHCKYATRLVEAIKSLEAFRSGKFTVGYHLRNLIHGLTDGSSHREGKFKSGTPEEAGGQSFEAIASFNQFYYECLSAEMRAELNGMRCEHHDFSYYRRQLGMDAEERKEKLFAAAVQLDAEMNYAEPKTQIIARVKHFIEAQAKEKITETPWEIDEINATMQARCLDLDNNTTEEGIEVEIKIFIGRWAEEEWQRILSSIYECVYITGTGLKSLLENNKERLFSMVVDG